MRNYGTITEVRSDYYCDNEHCYYIDVWVNDKDPGMPVAKVYDNPLRITCQPSMEHLFADPVVQEEIVMVVKEIIEEQNKTE